MTTLPNDSDVNNPTEDTREEWEIQRDELKATADNHFRSKSYALAIASYEAALQLDPTNYILLSNKSAAHLAYGEKSKALHDARRCVEYAPKDWVKGHTRLAAAMASLGRYGEAIKLYSMVLNEIDTDNEIAKKELENCRLKERQAAEEKRQEAFTVQMELDRQKGEKKEQRIRVNEKEESSSTLKHEKDDLLDDFFQQVEKVTEISKPQDDENTSNDSLNENASNRIKIHLNDLGTSKEEIDRLLQTNYEWKNLNPFNVLDIPHTVEDESIISARYRALSLLIHPDKNVDDPVRAKNAFEQVQKAMTQLNDEDKRRHIRALVEQGHKKGKKEWEEEGAKWLSHQTSSTIPKPDKESLLQAQNKATMKIFAEIEQKRREVEQRKRKFEQRERAQEDEEKMREKNEREHDKRWRDTNRVEKRVGNWRNFQVGSKKK